MLKVFMLPTLEQAKSDDSNAINQIVVRLHALLPNYGVEVTSDPNAADLVVGHAGQTYGVGQIDVAHCHGLYPTATPDGAVAWHFDANKNVIDNIIRARAVTVPSDWVADILRRDMHIDPKVVGWGVDMSEWADSSNGGYILWNKTRPDGVCNPKVVNDLAALRPDFQFITTFGNTANNVRVIGRQTFETMKEYVKRASVYLATTKETFGIATLEAMACGIPILGYRHGGTADIVEHGVTGYLANPGDVADLAAGLTYCIKYREVLGANARKAAAKYTWDAVAKNFAELYKSVVNAPKPQYKVAVVIPCHNYGKYVGEAIRSVARQHTNYKVQLVCVNDKSDDDSKDVILREINDLPEATYLESFFGNPADARNFGIAQCQSEYIVCLDADDRLGNDGFLQTLSDEMDKNRRLGVTFTGIKVMDADGNLSPNNSGWPKGYDYDLHIQRHNQVPTCCMFRREAWEKAGGYRRRYVPAEDAELWLRIGALGYTAKHVVDDGWFHYRMHANSLSGKVRTGDITEPNWVDKSWIASGRRPMASDGRPPNGHSWPVRNYDNPAVSVVIPVSPAHLDLLRDALDSVQNQTETNWECIVVNDCAYDITGMQAIKNRPWVRVVDTVGGGRGAGYARNVGVKHAKAPLIAFLDADDWMLSKFLELTIKKAERTDYGKYVYTDWYSLNKEGKVESHETPEYDPQDLFMKSSVHSINVLIRKDLLLSVGGFDETMIAWEDTDLFMKLAANGICGVRLPEKLIVYRYTTGSLREKGEVAKTALLDLLHRRYAEYIDGGKMCNCNELSIKTKAALSTGSQNLPAGDAVRIEYMGPSGMASVIGPATRHNYGRRRGGDFFLVYVEDQKADPGVFVIVAEPSVIQMPSTPVSEPVLI